MSTRLLAFSGSLRAESFNTRLAFLAADLAESKGAVVTRLKLQDLNLPMFDEDSEAASGLPAGAKELKDLMRAHDGFLIATPEYNGFMSGALKNAIDWATRPEEGHPPLDCFAAKTAGIMAASPGGLGGIRGLPMLRLLLSNIGVNVVGAQYAMGQAEQALAKGTANDGVQKVVDEVLRVAGSSQTPSL